MHKISPVITAMTLLVGGAAWAQGNKEGGPKDAKAQAPAATAAPAAPTLPPEGKRWVESMVGKWKSSDLALQMGDQKMTGKATMACEKTAAGWGALCKSKWEVKGMPTQEASFLFAWSIPNGTAHMFEVSNMGDTHNHAGKWTDDKTITVVHNGKNLEGKEEVDSLTFTWVSAKEIQVKADGKSGAVTNWSIAATMKK